MGRLNEAEFQATLAAPMACVLADEEPPFDFWPYFDRIPKDDFAGHECSAGTVNYVYRHPSGRFEHILVNSATRDVFMVVILDRKDNVVLGHRLLDLPALYGLTAG